MRPKVNDIGPLIIPDRINFPKIKKAILRIEKGTSEESVGATGFLIKELVKQPASAEIQEVIKHLINRLIRDSYSMCDEVRHLAIRELSRLIRELVKSKDLEGLRYVARASESAEARNKAMSELVKFEDLKGLRYIAQWGRHRSIRYKAVEELRHFKDTEGLRFVARWNMYKDTAYKGVKSLEKLMDKLIKSKDREGLKCLILMTNSKKIRIESMEGLEQMLDDIIKSKDMEALILVTGNSKSKIKRDIALGEIDDLKDLKEVIRETKNIYTDTCAKAVQKLENYIDEMVKIRDREGLEFLAEFSKNEKIWKWAINELHRLKEATPGEHIAEAIHKIFAQMK